MKQDNKNNRNGKSKESSRSNGRLEEGQDPLLKKKHQKSNQQQQQQLQLLNNVSSAQKQEANKKKNIGKHHINDQMAPPTSVTTTTAEHDHVDLAAKKASSNYFNCCSLVFRNKTWLFIILSMLLTFALTALLVAILFIPILQNDYDQCFNRFHQFQPTNYKLFTTKTSYSTAYQIITRNSNNNDTNSSSDFRGQQVKELPNIFSKTLSLKQLHDNLISKSQCKLKQLHFVGRHAARFPSSEQIVDTLKTIANIQNRIDLSKYSSPQQLQANETSTATTTTVSPIASTNSTVTLCQMPNHLAEYKQWLPSLIPEQGNLVVDSGMEETDAIARRFKSIYPEMFDGKTASINFGVTKELRTAQTATAFLKHIDNLDLYNCQPGSYPNENFSDKTKVDELLSNGCYKSLNDNYYKDKLEFHKKCESLHKSNFTIVHNLNLDDSSRTQAIADSISKKLELVTSSNSNKDSSRQQASPASSTIQQALTQKELKAIYRLCKYERANPQLPSIWCNLFSDQELKFLEYLDDVKDYFEVYGHSDQARSACSIATDLVRSFKLAKSNPTLEAEYLFTHADVIKKLLALSVDLESDAAYAVEDVIEDLKFNRVPRSSRQWRSSLFSPFSANIAFTIYECPASGGDETYLKLITSLNEQLILMDGCSEFACDLNVLLEDSRFHKEKRCRLEEICRKRIIIT